MLPEWTEESAPIRDHIICENHHEPYHVHMKSYVNKEYKMTVYYNQEYGELYDRINDPKELNNLWDNPKYQHIKGQLFQKFLYAEMGKEQLAMPRVTHA